MAKKGAFGSIEIGATPDVIGEISTMSLSQEFEEIDVTVMGTGNAANIPGVGTFRIEATVFYEQADAGQVAFLAALGSDAAPTQVIYYPEGKVTGKKSWTGNFFFMQYNTSQEATGAVQADMVMLNDGTGLTEGVVA